MTYLAFHRTSPKRAVTRDAPYIPGFECCGEVVRAGSAAIGKHPIGSSVVCFQSAKNQRYTERGASASPSRPAKASVDDPVIVSKPSLLTDERAVVATVPLRVATCTLSKQVYQAMSFWGENIPGTMVVIGAGGAVGSVVLQAARHEWPRSELIAICSFGKRDFALRNGASEVIAYDEDSEWSLDKEVCGKTDVVLDLIGGPESLRQGRRALRRGGVFNTTVGPVQFIGDGGHVSCGIFSASYFRCWGA